MRPTYRGMLLRLLPYRSEANNRPTRRQQEHRTMAFEHPSKPATLSSKGRGLFFCKTVDLVGDGAHEYALRRIIVRDAREDTLAQLERGAQFSCIRVEFIQTS